MAISLPRPLTEVAACRARWNTQQYAAEQFGTPQNERHREESLSSMDVQKTLHVVWRNSEYPSGCSRPFNTSFFFIGTWRTPTSAFSSSSSSTLHPPSPTTFHPNQSVNVNNWPSEIIPGLRNSGNPCHGAFAIFPQILQLGRGLKPQDTTRSIPEESGKHKSLGFSWIFYTPHYTPLLSHLGLFIHGRPVHGDQFEAAAGTSLLSTRRICFSAW